MSRSSTDHTDTPAFKKWFGESKVVDAKGLPLVVYHGTNKSFDKFKKKKQSAGGAIGFFFASASSGAEYHLSEKGTGRNENIMPVYLVIENPMVVSAREWNGYKDAEEFNAEALFNGNDGLIIRTTEGGHPYYDGDVWVAFRSSQIKSAIGNSGLYLRDSPSLTDHSAALTLDNAAAARSHIDEAFSCEARSRIKKVKP